MPRSPDVQAAIDRAKAKRQTLHVIPSGEAAKRNGRSRPEPVNGKAAPITAFTAADLKGMVFPPLKWIVRDLIPEGLTLLLGKPKLGKSWLCLEVAIAVSAGRFAFGTIECQQGDVLYLALEDNPRRLKRRMQTMLSDAEWPQRLTLETSCPRLDQGGLTYIRTWLEKRPEARLVLIDVLKKVRAPGAQGEGLYDADYQAGEALQALAAEFQVAIIAVHHARKASADDPLDASSSTTGLTGVADAVLLLGRDGQGTTLDVRGREVEEASLALSFSKVNCRWTIQGDAAEVLRSDARKAVLEVLLEADEPLSDSNIAAATCNKRETIASLLRRMVRDGEVHKIKRGRYVHPDRTDLEGEK